MTTSRRLVRSRNGWIAGVCAGLAEYLGWSVDAVRIMYVLVSIISVAFPGILVYIVLWILMPGPDSRESAVVE
jgi:phage shock protein PspC (stress-responsive transcriptional regulator)